MCKKIRGASTFELKIFQASRATSTAHQEDALFDSSTTNSSLDIGFCLDSNYHLNDELCLKLLRHSWVPTKMFNIKSDLDLVTKRVFRAEWLKTYPWLAYSAIAK